MAQYTVEITTEDELNERWVDTTLPMVQFKFNEAGLDDCPLLPNGKREATYNTREYPTDTVLKYIIADKDEALAHGSGTKTIHIKAGEYGLRP